MADINNTYKRFQNFQATNVESSLKKDFMEQNYKVEKSLEKKELETHKDLNNSKNLSSPDKSFLERSVKLGVNSQGNFFKK